MNDARKPSPDDPAVIPLEDSASTPKPVVCRMCFAKRIEKDGPCPSCGFDERAGLKPSTLVGSRPLGKAAMKCAKCGYDLTGLRSLRCPECGNVATPPSVREKYREESKQVAREAYRTPLLMIAIGGGLLFLFVLFTSGLSAAGLYMLSYLIEVPIGVAVFLLCCLIWIGFDAPIHLTALRLAGIYAVVDLLRVVLGFVIPIPFIGGIIALFIYIGLLSEMLEMELTDAIVVGLLTFAAKVIVLVAILAMMMG